MAVTQERGNEINVSHNEESTNRVEPVKNTFLLKAKEKMTNFRQLELAQDMFNQIKERYPDVELVDIVESGVYPDHLWIRLVLPPDDEQRWALREFAGELSIDILTTYGHHITIHSATKPERNAVSLAVA